MGVWGKAKPFPRATGAALPVLAASLVLWSGPVVGDGVLDAVMRGLAGVREVRGRFEETKEVPGVEGVMASRGVLTWRAPDRLERRTLEPSEEVLVIEGERLTYLRPGQGVRREFSLGSAPELRPLVDGLRAVLAGDRATLERFFEVTFSGSVEAWSLRLVPRSLAARGAVQRVTVSGAGASVRLVETQGNEATTLRVTPLP